MLASGSIVGLALAGVAWWGTAGASPSADAGAGATVVTSTSAASGPKGALTAPDKTAVLDRLGRLNQSGQFLFGQQSATLWGMYLDGRLVSTSACFDSTARTVASLRTAKLW